MSNTNKKTNQIKKNDRRTSIEGSNNMLILWEEVLPVEIPVSIALKMERGLKKLYPYYGCNNKDCNARVNISKHKLEALFEEKLQGLGLPAGKEALLTKVLENY